MPIGLAYQRNGAPETHDAPPPWHHRGVPYRDGRSAAPEPAPRELLDALLARVELPRRASPLEQERALELTRMLGDERSDARVEFVAGTILTACFRADGAPIALAADPRRRGVRVDAATALSPRAGELRLVLRPDADARQPADRAFRALYEVWGDAAALALVSPAARTALVVLGAACSHVGLTLGGGVARVTWQGGATRALLDAALVALVELRAAAPSLGAPSEPPPRTKQYGRWPPPARRR
jgi:hypothetical protein